MKPHDFTRFTLEKNKEWLHRDKTEKIIGAALEVHKILGNGFLEYVYQRALCYELSLKSIKYEAQKMIDIKYKDLVIKDKYVADILVDNDVMVELKATSGLTNNDEAQLINYLKATGIRVGLLLNFGTQGLEVRRKIV